MTDFDRYEAYSTSFKRRAISPSASVAGSSNVGSPILGMGPPNQPTPPPLSTITTISIPSPTIPQTSGFMSFLPSSHSTSAAGSRAGGAPTNNSSRQGSPAPSLSSVSSRVLAMPASNTLGFTRWATDTERDVAENDMNVE